MKRSWKWRFFVIGLQIVVLLSCLNAVIYFFNSEFYPRQDSLARAYHALRLGFFGVPDTVQYIVRVTVWLFGMGHEELTLSLGYDPFDITVPEISFPFENTPSTQGEKFSQPQGLEDSPWSGFALRTLLEKIVILTIAQFAFLLAVLKSDALMDWPLPGIPVIISRRGKLAYWFGMALSAAVLVYQARDQGQFFMAITALAGLLCLWLPLVPGLPLWFVHEVIGLKVRPTGPTGLPGPRNLGRAETGRLPPNSRRSLSAPRNTKPPIYREDAAQPSISTESIYNAACAHMGLVRHSFDEKGLRQRWREQIRQDQAIDGGMGENVRNTQAAYEQILNYHGFSR